MQERGGRPRPQNEGVFNQESHEKPFAGKVVLVTGGASGTGSEVATLLHTLGAQVIIGTRSREKFDKTAQALGGENVFPFVADLAETDQVDNALKSLREQNIQPSIIVHAAAGGMEKFFKKLLRPFVAVKRAVNEAEKAEKLEILREIIKKEVDASMDEAREINFEGPKRLIEQMSRTLPPGSKIIFYSSLWSSIYGEENANVPDFYRGIASTKKLFEDWLMANAKALAERGIHPAIISGHLIKDSETGNAIDGLLSISPEIRESMEDSYIKKEDMVKATLEVIKSDPKTWKEPCLRLFVTKDGISDNLPKDSPLRQIHLPI